MGRPARFQVVEVVADGLPRYVALQRMGEPFIDLAWQSRNIVDNRLMGWLRELDEPPDCHVLLGQAAQLTYVAALALVRFRREQIARMARAWPGVPDFALWAAVRPGGRGRRPCAKVRDARVERYLSILEAARSNHTSIADLERRLVTGCRDAWGWVWWSVSQIEH